MTDAPGAGSAVEAGEKMALADFAPQRKRFVQDVIDGLQQPQKRIPPKYFYDERGSRLFDRICELEEYYLTRTELGILRENIAQIAGIVACAVC